jgi:hypothetical protein
MTSKLDERFGRCEKPGRPFSREEQNLKPQTLFSLSADSASHIDQLIRASQRGNRNKFSCSAVSDFTIIWLVTESGNILVSFEEGVLNTGNSVTHFPLPTALKKAATNDPDYIRLGHPALVSAQAARIGGEIFCQLNEDPPQWYISNRSGRYGIGLNRTEQQLQNVAEEFDKVGI